MFEKLKFYTRGASIPEGLGYPLEFSQTLMYKIIDMAIEMEREELNGSEEVVGFSKFELIDRFRAWFSTTTELDIPIDMNDPNLNFLLAFIINDVMYKHEMTNAWMSASQEEQRVISKYFGKLFSYYAHKRQIMFREYREENGDLIE